MINMGLMMERLSKRRPIFHSEADFQHELAWEIHCCYTDASIRLEYNYPYVTGHMFLDIVVTLANRIYPIELKYKTKRISTKADNEAFTLREHGAQDCGRYDLVKDICRLEKVATIQPEAVGYAIMLTNDSSYWKPSQQPCTADAEFRIYDGRNLHGNLNWGETASYGTTKGRERSLKLQNDYILSWHPYATLDIPKYNEFKYLIAEIRRDG